MVRKYKPYVRTGRRFLGAAVSAYHGYNSLKRKLPTGKVVNVSTRKRFKGKGSWTVTKKNNKTDYKKKETTSSYGRTGVTLRFSPRKYSPKFMKFISARQTVSTTNADGGESGSKAASYMHMSILDKDDINQIITTASRQKTYEANSTAWDPNATGEKDYRVYVQAGSAEFRIANNSHHPMELIIYAYKCRNDSNAGPKDMMEANLGSGVFGGAGLNAGKLAANDTLTTGYVGLYPQDCAQFRRFYTITEQEKITLNPGSTHIYRVHATWNKILSTAMKYGDGGVPRDNYHYKGYTGGVLFRYSGYPIHSQTAGEHSRVQLSTCRLDVVMIKRYNYRVMAMSREHFEVKDWQDNFTTGGEWYDPGSGVMEKVVAGVVSTSTDET